MGGTLAWTLILLSSSAAATFSHVRSEQSTIRAWIVEGYEHSRTFRALVDEIDSLPGIVYIDATVAIPHGLDGALLHRVMGSRELPLLRVQLRLSLSRDVGISVLAHELQHVAEVLRAGRMADSSAMTALFASIDEGHGNGSSRFETEAARGLAGRVLDELRLSKRR